MAIDEKDIKEAKRMTKMFKRIAGEMAKRPNLVKAGKAGIAVGDLFFSPPGTGGKLRSAARAKKATEMMSKSLMKKIAAKRAAQNEAEKAILAGGGAAAATYLSNKKNKK